MDYTFYKNKMPVLVQIFKTFVFNSVLCDSNIESAIHFLYVCYIFNSFKKSNYNSIERKLPGEK